MNNTDNKLLQNSSRNNSFNFKKTFSTIETILLVVMSLLIGLTIGSLLNNKEKEKVNNKVNDEYLNEFIKNYNYIIDNYYDKVDKESLINNAISGMMNSLNDPYSMSIDKTTSNNFSATLNGSYNGIGVEITKDDVTNYMLVVSVIKNSPAAKSGIVAGDLIISINESESTALTASEFSDLIKSSKTDLMNLKISRNGEEINIILNRAEVVLDSVISKTFKENNKTIGYIYIGIFANNTYAQFKEKLDELEKEQIDSLIIDVRGNTGGHLTAVDSILDLFLNSKQIMYKFSKNNEITNIYGKGTDNKKYEIILLGDESSASASEVLIAGLKENLNSKFIGKKTYGKGTVQELITLSDGSQYKITVKKWLTPNGNWINETKGIVPDMEIEIGDKYQETFDDMDDNQLQKALDYIKEK